VVLGALFGRGELDLQAFELDQRRRGLGQDLSLLVRPADLGVGIGIAHQ
jgi:hypothetical protein